MQVNKANAYVVWLKRGHIRTQRSTLPRSMLLVCNTLQHAAAADWPPNPNFKPMAHLAHFLCAIPHWGVVAARYDRTRLLRYTTFPDLAPAF